MNQLLSLISSSNSLWEILPPLVTLLAILVILLKCLPIFVKSWMQERKLLQIFQLLIQTSEQFLAILSKSLKNPSETEQQNEESMSQSQNLQPVEQDPLLLLATKLKEVIEREEH